MTYYLFILGCQQNYYDAERISNFLEEKMGYVRVAEKEAGLIIALACSVRQKAVDRIYGKLRQWKKKGQEKIVILSACVLPQDRKKLESKVDAIIETDEIEEELTTRLLFERSKAKSRTINQNFSTRPSTDSGLGRRIKSHAFLSIMSGCNNFCSYCAVPYTRGRERSRLMEEIVCEAKSLVKNGAREITLLGQNVNSYKISKRKAKSEKQPASRGEQSKTKNNDNKNRNDFVELLVNLETIDKLEKISFLTSHPKDMSRSLIEWMGKSKKFSRELHLPLQSGDDEILKKMNRRYASEDYVKLVRKIKRLIPDIRLSTDIIVGFPDETKEQFDLTVKVCKIIGFDKAYVSQYSPRLGTAAAKFEDNVSRYEKKRRWKILDALINHKP